MLPDRITTMSARARALLLLSAGALAGVFVSPLWTIRLVAPQYPEGLGMQIRVNTIVGLTPTDLGNINGLNHYIGMKVIDPALVPVLKVMPWVVAALCLGVLLVAFTRHRRLLQAWLGVFAIAAAVGLAEFWWWEYDYGHDIDTEHAIIKIPGMSYQPPLIGSKQLLNFTAHSAPAFGAYLAGAAFALALAALLMDAERWSFHGRRVGGSGARSGNRHAAIAAGGILLLAVALPGNAQSPSSIRLVDSVVVSPAGGTRSVSAALRLVVSGGRVIVRPGVYREPTIVVDRPVTIVGQGMPTLDGNGTHQIMTIVADDVVVAGIRFASVGTSFVEDRAAIKVVGARGCAITDNQIDDSFFGIYLAKTTDCRVERNVIRGRAIRESTSGNGIHLWSSRRIIIADNEIAGHRDGIYFEFVHDSRIERNRSEHNLRYGLHFMYSDDCHYIDNTFRANGSGVAVMYTKGVEMAGNTFDSNWGAASYGLLLKEISDVTFTDNVLRRNTTAMLVDGAARLDAAHNLFLDNGWALRLEANTVDSRIRANDFEGNTFDVSTNGRGGEATFRGNYWDSYRGYDLNRDGVGDVPHHPVRLFSLIAQRNETSLVLLRSALVDLLDGAERVLPSLTPEMAVDSAPAMQPPRRSLVLERSGVTQ